MSLRYVRLLSISQFPCIASNHKLTILYYIQANSSSVESLLTSEDAVIAAAASEALTLAKAAAKLAKDATLLVSNKPPSHLNQQPPLLPSTPENLLLKWVQHMEATEDAASAAVSSIATGPGPDIMEHLHISPNQEEDFNYDDEPTSEELEDVEEQLFDTSIDARSGRQTERKARRVRASGKAATNIVSFKSGSTTRKKRVRTQEVDYSDPLRYLRSTTRTTRLLTPSEEVKFSEGIQVKFACITT